MGTPAELTQRFIEMATEAETSINRVTGSSNVGPSIKDWIDDQNLPARAVISPDPIMDSYGWEQASALDISRGATRGDDLISVTPTIAGIAETGSIMVATGPGTPYTLNFLPETHIAIVHTNRIVGGYEDAWAMVQRNGEVGVALPRTVTVITGPSRSSDIERTVTVGVHGPKRLHFVLVDTIESYSDGQEI